MGWNQGYTIFEATVIGAYDRGKLDKELLSSLMEQYRGTDIDSGGSRDLIAKDGKEVEEIVIIVMGKTPPAKPEKENSNAWGQYYDDRFSLFNEITRKTFGWC